MFLIPITILALRLVTDPPVAETTSVRDAMAQANTIVQNNRARASIATIGNSWSGQPIEVITLSENLVDAAKKPAICSSVDSMEVVRVPLQSPSQQSRNFLKLQRF